jgi:hypothetical protein
MFLWDFGGFAIVWLLETNFVKQTVHMGIRFNNANNAYAWEFRIYLCVHRCLLAKELETLQKYHPDLITVLVEKAGIPKPVVERYFKGRVNRVRIGAYQAGWKCQSANPRCTPRINRNKKLAHNITAFF